MCCLYGIPHLFPLLCSDSATGPSPLCLSQLITVPSLSYSCRVVELLHMVGGALVITLCVSRWGVSCGGWLPSEIWATSGGCCLSRCQQWPLLPHSGITLGLGHLCVPWSSLFPGDGFPRSNCCAMTQNRQDGSVVGTLGWGAWLAGCWKPRGLRANLSLPCLKDSQCMPSL